MVVRLSFCVFAILLTTSDLASAGAWPQEKGVAFISLQARQDAETLDDLPVASIFAEYGLSEHLTVGGKIDYTIDTEDVSYLKFFARWHLPENSGKMRKALSIAVEGDFIEPYITSAFHLGQGIETPIGAGWFDAELSVKVSTQDLGVRYGTYALFGVKPHPKIMTMMALDVGSTDGETQVNAIPSVAWQFKQGKHLQMEWSHALKGDEKDEVALGLWLEF